jgi:hypothetical protein
MDQLYGENKWTDKKGGAKKWYRRRKAIVRAITENDRFDAADPSRAIDDTATMMRSEAGNSLDSLGKLLCGVFAEAEKATRAR